MSPEDWGWLGPDTDIKRKYDVSILSSTGKSAKYQKDVSTTETAAVLTNGTYTWQVSAVPDTVEVPSEQRTFSVCAVDGPSSVALTSPGANEYVNTSTVTLAWEVPSKNSDCAPDDVYNYTVEATKDGKTTVASETIKGLSRTYFDLTLAGEGTYTWQVVVSGPAGVESKPSSRTFEMCLKSAPGSPTAFGYTGTGQNNAVVCSNNEDGGGNATLPLRWAIPNSTGKQCTKTPQDVVYLVRVCSGSGNNCTEAETRELQHSMEVPCTTQSYTAQVSAHNGYSYGEPSTITVGVCEQIKPDVPAVNGVGERDYCRSATLISWNHSDAWGTTCDGNEDKTFAVTYRKGAETRRRVFAAQDLAQERTGGHVVYRVNETLGRGTWAVSVKACLGKDTTFCSGERPESVEGAGVPEAVNLRAVNDGTNLTFSWETDEGFMGCENKGEFSYTLEYEVNGEERSAGLPVGRTNNHTVGLVFSVYMWGVTLNSTADPGAKTAMRPYSTSDDCVEVKPRWGDIRSALTEPADEGAVFENVTFRWKEVDSFGIACIKVPSDDDSSSSSSSNSSDGATQQQQQQQQQRREQLQLMARGENNDNTQTNSNIKSVLDTNPTKYYTVNVSGHVIDAGNATSVTEVVNGTGEQWWTVTAHFGNVETTTGKKMFCVAARAPNVSVRCPTGPQTGRTLKWDSGYCK